MLSSRNECGRESLSLVHRKQFLKARYVSFLRYVPCDSSIGTLESTKNSQKDWKLFDRDGRKFYYTNDFKNDQFQSWDANSRKQTGPDLVLINSAFQRCPGLCPHHFRNEM